MSGKNSRFSVGECGELVFTKGTAGRIFDLRETGENGETGTVKNGHFVPFCPRCCPIFLYPQPSMARIPRAMPAIPPPPPTTPYFPPFFSISPFS